MPGHVEPSRFRNGPPDGDGGSLSSSLCVVGRGVEVVKGKGLGLGQGRGVEARVRVWIR